MSEPDNKKIKHLWEVRAKGYWADKAYHQEGTYERFEAASWGEFVVSAYHVHIPDYASLHCIGYHWDRAVLPGQDQYYRNGTLELYFLVRRKGIYASCTVSVCDADEQAVGAYLNTQLKALLKLWGFSGDSDNFEPPHALQVTE